jgi:hypothetical protein
MNEPTRQDERLQRVEEAMLFTQHGQDQLAEHVRELNKLIGRLDARVSQLEELTRRADQAMGESGDGEAGDVNDGRR